jgi:glycosyltransferase involved in cell wall biosynthesis
LEAAAVVLREQPQAKLFLVVTIPSDRHLARLRRGAEELGIAGRVVITEPQPLAAIPRFLAAGDVAVVPRPQSPGFPIKILNYMAARRPCVLFASSSGGLTHRENAFLVQPDTSDALGHGILELLGDDDLRQHLAENAYRYVREQRNRALTAQQVCAVYRRTLESRGPITGLSRRPSVGARPATASANSAERPSNCPAYRA